MWASLSVGEFTVKPKEHVSEGSLWCMDMDTLIAATKMEEIGEARSFLTCNGIQDVSYKVEI